MMTTKRVPPAKKRTRREMALRMRKLGDEEVKEARLRYGRDESIVSIAKHFGVCRHTARRAIYGEGIYDGM